ncbi:MAG: hypothetical protein AAGD32_15735 [Planctomycetota bacterium]
MPVYLITLHAYGTWLPDRKQGSVHWRRGLQGKSDSLARAYRRKQRQAPAEFDVLTQNHIANEFQSAAPHQGFTAYAAALDPTHVHLLLGWRGDRSASRMRINLKHSLTQRLNREVRRRTWFSKGGHEKRVHDPQHMALLRETYLPSHLGVTWDCDRE